MLKSPLPTTEMQVTSIRFERELIDRLKHLAGQQGYQAFVREILWQYVHTHRSPEGGMQPNGQPQMEPQIQPQQIRTTIAAATHGTERCALTGEPIAVTEKMWLGLTPEEHWVPLSEAGIRQLRGQRIITQEKTTH